MGLSRHSAALLALLLCLVSSIHGYRDSFRATRNTVRFEATLTWEDWSPAGIPRKIILCNGLFPAPTLELEQGDDVEFLVINNLPFSTSIHFHGITQQDTPWSDGVPGLSQRPIAPGDRFLYKWRATEYGSYFYHAHNRAQMEDGLYGTIHIRAADSVQRPFSLITEDPKHLQAMRAAEEMVSPILMSDMHQLTSEELWDVQEATGLDAFCVNALLINGKGSVTCLGKKTLDEFTTPAQRQTLGNRSFTDIGCSPPMNTLLQGNYPHNFSALPSSVFSGCTPSHGLTERLFVNPELMYVAYNLIGSTSGSMITFSIDEHPMYVYAIDGRYIVPTLVDAITIPTGNRYSVLVKLDKPAGDYTIRIANTGVNQIINGTAIMAYFPAIKTQEDPSEPSIDITGTLTSSRYTLLDERAIIPFPPVAPAKDVAETSILTIRRHGASYIWTLGNTTFPMSLEEAPPLLYHPSTANKRLILQTHNSTWVDLIIHVTGPLQPPHPIHKHSNKFFVIGEGVGVWNYSSVAEAMRFIPENFNLQTPQIRDTYVTPPVAGEPTWLAIRYQVVNPGAFLLHCHIQDHLSGGMALALLDGIDEWPEIPEEYRLAESGSRTEFG